MAAREGRLIGGRQALLLVHQHFQVDEKLGALYSIRDVMNVKWLGDGRLEEFLDNWEYVIQGLQEPIPISILEPLFLERARLSAILKDEIGHYDRIAQSNQD